MLEPDLGTSASGRISECDSVVLVLLKRKKLLLMSVLHYTAHSLYGAVGGGSKT